MRIANSTSWRLLILVLTLFITLLASRTLAAQTPICPDNAGWVEVGGGSACDEGISVNSGRSGGASLAITQEGTPIVAWQDRTVSLSKIYVKKWNGSAWTEIGAGSASGNGINNTNEAGSPSLAITPDGKPIVAWFDYAGTGHYEIYVRQWDGSAWIEVGTGSATGRGISNSSDSSVYPHLAIDPDGYPVVAWEDRSGGGDHEIYIRRWNGSTWAELGTGSATGRGISNNSGYSGQAHISFDNDGNPIVAWQDRTSGNWEIYILRWDGNTWIEMGSGSATAGGISNNSGTSGYPSLVVTPGGTPIVAWYDDSSGSQQIYVKRWDGAAWVEMGSDSASGGGISNSSGTSYFPSMAILPDGTPIVTWNDNTSGNYEIYVRRWDGTNWVEMDTGSASGGGISNSNGDSRLPSMAIDAAGRSIIAWDDNSVGNSEIYVRSNEPPFEVNLTDPQNADLDVSADKILDAEFNQNVDFSTVNSDTFTVRGEQTGDYVGSFFDGANAVQFDSTDDFKPGEEVVVTMSQGLLAESGVPLIPYTWQFNVAVPGGSGNFLDSGQNLGDLRSNGSALGDFDGDGDLDIFVGNVGYTGGGQPNQVWLYDDGTGTFINSGQTLGNYRSYRIALGDLDGDGDLDAFVSNFNGHPNKVWLNDGNANFTDNGQSLGNSDSLGVKLGDLDGDGDLDAFVTNHRSQPNKVWLYDDGTGNFIDSGQNLGNSSSGSVDLGDVDGDGDLDAVVGNAQGHPSKVWLNDGQASFSDSGQVLGNLISHGGVALGDLDGDGDLDTLIGNKGSDPNTVWFNDGSGIFTHGQNLGSSNTHGIALGDLDGDGDLDAFSANPSQPNKVWLNDGNGNFSVTLQDLGNWSSETVSLGDLDGDGDLDAFVGNDFHSNKVWLNQLPNTPPLVIAGGPYSGDEGTDIPLDGATASDDDGDPLIYSWDVNSTLCSFSDPAALNPEIACADNGNYTATLTVSDGVNDPVSSDATITVSNADPIINVVNNSGPINEGGSATITVDASDPAGANDPLLYAFDCDNDAVYEIIPQAANNSQCTFADDGTYPAGVRVTDDDDGAAPGSTTVTVNNVAPTIVLTGDAFVDEGSVYTLNLGAVTDPGDDTISEYIVAWGDGSSESFFSAGDVTHIYDDGDAARTVSVSLVDEDGTHPGAGTLSITVNNVAPTAVFNNGGPVDEGSAFVLTLTAPTDPSTADTAAGFEYAFDCGDGNGFGAFSSNNNANCPTDDNGFRSVKGQIKDKDGGVSEYLATVEVFNVAPTIDYITGPVDPVNINDQPITVIVGFSDPGTADTHDVTWEWGDSSSDTQHLTISPTAAEHTYAATGVYPVIVTVTDDDGDYDTATYEFIVIYDPEGGFVTGGGWIDSPAGAYTADPDLTGKANFGFVSKYKKGANIPTGSTNFQFKAGDLHFKSTSYDWLVIAGKDKAKYKGVGSINGSGNFGFMLTATDGDPDTFRIKIWDKDAGDGVVYDNKMGESDDGYTGITLGGGNIVVHTGKK